jgi:hypothetical protein
MRLWIAMAAVLFIIAGCKGIPNEEAFKAKVSTWQGRNINDVIAAWGQPSSTLRTPGGGMLYTYNKGEPVATSCVVDFVVDAAKKITAWRYSGTTCRTTY